MADILGFKDGSLGGEIRLKNAWSSQLAARRFSLIYEVQTRNLNENWSTIQFDPKLPQMGDVLNGCRCCGSHFREVKTVWDNGKPKILYEIEYEYSSETTGGSGFPTGSTTSSPDEWPFEFDFDSTSFTDQLRWDAVSGEPVATPCGEVIPLETDRGALIMHVSGYEGLAFWPDLYIQRLYRVNKNVFLNMGPGHVLIKSISAKPTPINGKLWFYVTYTLEMRDNNDHPFAAEVLNHGTKCRTEINGEIHTTAEVLGRNCTVNLDDDGVIYEGDEPPILVFEKYQPIDFDEFFPTERFESRILWNGDILVNRESEDDNQSTT